MDLSSILAPFGGPFGTLFRSWGPSFGVHICCYFLGTLPERFLGDLRAETASPKGAFGDICSGLSENVKTLIFETPHAV